MAAYCTALRNFQIVIALLKANGIRKVIASPGSTNIPFVISIQKDPFFEVYSSVDERSAAYMACGLAAESGEAVVITCTGATASRNYLPGLTEAYYRRLPILAITGVVCPNVMGILTAQVIDRSITPKDAVKMSVELPIINSAEDEWLCNLKVNSVISELFRHGGGPVHINIVSDYRNDTFDATAVCQTRKILRIMQNGDFPELPRKRIGIFVGSHVRWTSELTQVVEKFCAKYDAVVFCDHTSNYHGKGRVLFSLACSQQGGLKDYTPDIMIHLGSVSGDYATSFLLYHAECWRVSPDGNMADTSKRLKYVFEMDEVEFFSHYIEVAADCEKLDYCRKCNEYLLTLRAKLSKVDVPFSNIWVASQTAHQIPTNSVVHLGILNSLRSWNFFDFPNGTECFCNTGGFGIDGCLSSLLGGALAQPEKLHFCICGDLAFFYDLNALGNRHVCKNLRIMLINNGRGTEFRNYLHTAAKFGDNADEFIAAAGHYGKQSPLLVKHYAEDLGFDYISASNKAEFAECCQRFVASTPAERPLIFEVFTNYKDESDALFKVSHLHISFKNIVKKSTMSLLGKKNVVRLKRILK